MQLDGIQIDPKEWWDSHWIKDHIAKRIDLLGFSNRGRLTAEMDHRSDREYAQFPVPMFHIQNLGMEARRLPPLPPMQVFLLDTFSGQQEQQIGSRCQRIQGGKACGFRSLR
jgi:hypothetical protein